MSTKSLAGTCCSFNLKRKCERRFQMNPLIKRVRLTLSRDHGGFCQAALGLHVELVVVETAPLLEGARVMHLDVPHFSSSLKILILLFK